MSNGKNRSNELEFHKLANFFPLMGKVALRQLANDIEKNGLETPIELFEGKIFDGRNRYIACNMVGIKPRFVEFDSENNDPHAHLISQNIHRRHMLNPAQRAQITNALLKDKEEKRQAKFEKEKEEILAEATTDEEQKAAEEIIRKKEIELQVEKHRDKIATAKAGGMQPKTLYEMEEIEEKAEEIPEIKADLEDAVKGKGSIKAISDKIKGKPKRITQKEKFKFFHEKIDKYQDYIRGLVKLVEEALPKMPNWGEDVKDFVEEVNDNPFIKALKSFDRTEDGGAIGWSADRWREELEEQRQKLKEEA